MPKKDEAIKTEIISGQSILSDNGHTEEEIKADKEGARTKLIEHLTDTPDSKIPEETFTPRRMIAALSISRTISELPKLGAEESPFVAWQNTFFRMMRSVGSAHVNRLHQLAESQLGLEEENQPENPYDTP